MKLSLKGPFDLSFFCHERKGQEEISISKVDIVSIDGLFFESKQKLSGSLSFSLAERPDTSFSGEIFCIKQKVEESYFYYLKFESRFVAMRVLRTWLMDLGKDELLATSKQLGFYPLSLDRSFTDKDGDSFFIKDLYRERQYPDNFIALYADNRDENSYLAMAQYFLDLECSLKGYAQIIIGSDFDEFLSWREGEVINLTELRVTMKRYSLFKSTQLKDSLKERSLEAS